MYKASAAYSPIRIRARDTYRGEQVGLCQLDGVPVGGPVLPGKRCNMVQYSTKWMLVSFRN